MNEHIKSALITFSSVFLLTITSVSDVSWTKTAIVALMLTAVRAGIKAVAELLPTFIAK